MRLSEPVIVVGAGIGGLTAALALAHAGFEVQVFERAPQLHAIGAGIQLSANALRVLAGLGLIDDVTMRGTAAKTVTLRDARSGRPIARVPVTASDGTGYVAIHRGDLQTILLAAADAHRAIRLMMGRALSGLQTTRAGVALDFRDESGRAETRTAPLVVGADGVFSACANALGLPPALPSGMAALRWIATAASGAAMDGIEAWLGPRRHAVAYPIRAGNAVNIVLIAPEAELQAEGAASIRHWDPRLRALIDSGQPAGLWPLSTTPSSRPMTALGALALVGDAGHAMLPYAAQGGAMAIEDAWVLARSVQRAGSVADALSLYEAARRPRIERVRARVGFHRLVYHLPHPLSLARDAALAVRSPSALQRDLAWLYDWRPDG